MTAPPAPLEWHPAYRGKTDLLGWLDNPEAYPVVQVPFLEPPRVTAYHADDPAEDTKVRVHTLTKQRAQGLAPYVGRPFCYRWAVATDQLGRSIAGEARIEYIDTYASHHTFEVYHYHWEALNGHNPDLPVWP